MYFGPGYYGPGYFGSGYWGGGSTPSVIDTPSGVSPSTKRKPIRISFNDGDREKNAEYIKAQLRLRYPIVEPATVPTEAAKADSKQRETERKMRMEAAKVAAAETRRIEIEQAQIKLYNEQIMALILLAAQ